MDKQLKKEKQNLIDAVRALGINPVSLAGFLEVHVQASQAVKNLTGDNPFSERAICEATLLMYTLQDELRVSKKMFKKGGN